MAVFANVSGTPIVGNVMTAIGTSDGIETLTGYQWESATTQAGTYSSVAGETSITYAIGATLRCKWLRVQITFDDGGGGTVYAYSDPVRVGPCGGGRSGKGGTASNSKTQEPTPPQPAAPQEPPVFRKARKIALVDTSKWVTSRGKG